MSLRLLVLSVLFWLGCLFRVLAQDVPLQGIGSQDIIHGIWRLGVCGTVLYIAAHPDDENTRLIAWLANERRYHTVYLSLTRGDGGQNLIGKEQGEAIGVIRTHELMQARHVDGGVQAFTRAYDFGYSKNPEETFRLWDRQQVLADVVYAIRSQQPDVVIARFPEDGSGGHGHHTASALLAREAFKLAADSTAFPEQLKTVAVWQATRLYWNAWIPPGQQATPEMERTMLAIDVGAYNALLGVSYTELAGASRSMHKSQGFGAAQTVGSRLDYLKLLEGKPHSLDFMDGIRTDWSRVPEGAPIQKSVESLQKNYQPERPEHSVKALLALYTRLQRLPFSVYKSRKLQECKNLIFACTGFKAEFLTSSLEVYPSGMVSASLQLTNRSTVPFSLRSVSIPACTWDTSVQQILSMNNTLAWTVKKALRSNQQVDMPVWLRTARQGAMFTTEDASEACMPVGKPSLYADILVEVDGTPLTCQLPAVYKVTDPVKGEITRATAVLPSVVVQAAEQVVFADSGGRVELKVLVRNTGNGVKGTLYFNTDAKTTLTMPEPRVLDLPAGEQLEVTSVIKGVTLSVDGAFQCFASFVTESGVYQHDIQRIEYDHIGVHHVFPRCQWHVIVQKPLVEKGRIAYLPGPGDEVAKCLEAMGQPVTLIEAASLPTLSQLLTYKAVVVGVRAFNTNGALTQWKPALIRFVEEGGTVVVQYQTNRGLVAELPFPFSLEIGRSRVTEEQAEVRPTGQASWLLTSPNTISGNDWKDWVQERGLYHAQRWDDRFLTPLEMNDTNEKPDKGSLLVLPYGKGYFVYTGLAFFRQLPAGVPGAYKLFANLLSMPKAIPKP